MNLPSVAQGLSEQVPEDSALSNQKEGHYGDRIYLGDSIWTNHLYHDQSDEEATRSEEEIPRSIGVEADSRPIVVTGFGPVSSLPGDINMSATVMQEFYNLEGGTFTHNSEKITILTGTEDMMNNVNDLEPIKTSYTFVTKSFNDWLMTVDARLFVHLGTKPKRSDEPNPIIFEFQACNGYDGFWVQDDFDSPEYKDECVPGGCKYLKTSFNIRDLINRVQEKLTPEANDRAAKPYSLCESTDAGHFLCDFLYYRSLFYHRNVIFIHVPEQGNLSADVTGRDLARVLQKMVHCLLEMCDEEEVQIHIPEPNIIRDDQTINRPPDDRECYIPTDEKPFCVLIKAAVDNGKATNGNQDRCSTCNTNQAVITQHHDIVPAIRKQKAVFKISPTAAGEVENGEQATCTANQSNFRSLNNRRASPAAKAETVKHGADGIRKQGIGTNSQSRGQESDFLHQQQHQSAQLRADTRVIANPIPNRRSNVPDNNMQKIVVTGFDPVSKFNPKPNLSWTVVQKFFYSQTNGIIEHNSIPYQLMTGPSQANGEIQPIKTTYNYMTSSEFDNWLRSSNAWLYIHLGVDDELDNAAPSSNVMRFDTQANNGYNGYWDKDNNGCGFPGPCIGSGSDYLHAPFSSESLEALATSLPKKVKREKINGSFSFKVSTEDDVDHSLCNFLYYRSLYYAEDRNKELDSAQQSHVIFIHMPSRLKDRDGNPLSKVCSAAPSALILELIVHSLLDTISK